jgi:ABC-type branched-subunit amino acid transport system substrate-binding protein
MKLNKYGAIAVVGTLLLAGACGTNTGADDSDSAASALSSDNCADPDAAEKEITGELVFGFSAALSGPAAQAIGQVLKGAEARFDELNEAGGIDGVKIKVVKRDDGFTPERAKANAQALIDKDKADVLSTLGGGQVDAMADYQNEQCVPLLNAISSVPKLYDAGEFPWTTQDLPAASIEEKAIAKLIQDRFPNGVDVAMASNPNESGKSYSKAFEDAIEGTNIKLVKNEPIVDPATTASTLKATGAKVLNIGGIGADCVSMMTSVGRAGWKPDLIVLPSNCTDGKLVFEPAGEAADGVQILRWFKEPTLEEYADDPDVAAYASIVKAAGVDPNSSYVLSGYVTADITINALEEAAKSEDGLSHIGIMKAARTQDYTAPLFIDGVTFTLDGDKDPFGIDSFRPYAWNSSAKKFEPVGEVVSAK